MAAATRRIGPFEVSAIGLGCMNLSHAYGTPPPPAQAAEVIACALDLGITHFDTAALYGFGRNEELVGPLLAPHRGRILLASKGGMTGEGGRRTINGRPDALRRDCEASLKRLGTDVIDLYYLHRWDKAVPIEDSVGTLGRLVEEGKVRALGLSEVSAATLRRAHATHEIVAVQSEYSLWTRNPEIAVLDACREIGATLVAFSPLARGFFAGAVDDPNRFVEKDVRRALPRFQEPHFSANLRLLAGYRAIASDAGCTMAQLALAWLLAQGDLVTPIPGTTNAAHLAEDVGAVDVRLDAETVARLDALVNQKTVAGARYAPETEAQTDTEQFD